MSEGHILYQGTPDQSIRHFESLGYRRPLNVDAADFLLAVRGEVKEVESVSEGERPDICIGILFLLRLFFLWLTLLLLRLVLGPS